MKTVNMNDRVYMAAAWDTQADLSDEETQGSSVLVYLDQAIQAVQELLGTVGVEDGGEYC